MKVLYALLIFVPIAILARLLGAPPIAVFILSALAIVPLSGVMGAATECVAEHTSPAIGGVLSATMGNLAELIIASVALRAGLIDLVKASITDGEVCDWVLRNVKKSDADKASHRDFLFNRGREDDAAIRERLKLRKQEAGLAHRDDIQTFVDFIDADEKRS